MTEQKDKIIPVDYDSVKMDIFIRANSEGPIEDIESWRKAFPDVEFEGVDEDITGEEIGWKNRTAEERAFYVAYMKDPQATEVDYMMEVEDIRLFKKIEDPERIWCMWMAGCFAGGELDETAIKTFFWYADDSELARRYVDDLDLDQLKIMRLSVKVAPL